MSGEGDSVALFTRIPVELHRELKVRAAETGTPMTALVEKAIRELLKKKPRARN